jgi:hypothetical protein
MDDDDDDDDDENEIPSISRMRLPSQCNNNNSKMIKQ